MSIVKSSMIARGSKALASLALCALAVWIAGCQGKPVDQTTQNINTFKQLGTQLTDARKQVGKTLDALDKYSQKPGLDTYNRFVSEIQNTQSQADAIRNTVAVMSDQGDSYFVNWDAELAGMTNANLKDRSEEQKAATQHAYHQIGAQGPALRAAYDKFVGDLNNLQTYFDRDKSASGVGSASNLIATTNADGVELQRQIDVENANLAQVQSLFTTMKKKADGVEPVDDANGDDGPAQRAPALFNVTERFPRMGPFCKIKERKGPMSNGLKTAVLFGIVWVCLCSMSCRPDSTSPYDYGSDVRRDGKVLLSTQPSGGGDSSVVDSDAK